MTTVDTYQYSEDEIENSKIAQLKRKLENRMNIDEEDEFSQDSEEEVADQDEKKIRIHFRNYVPRDNHLKRYILKHDKSTLLTEPTEEKQKPTQNSYLDSFDKNEDKDEKEDDEKKKHMIQKFFQSPEEATEHVLKDIINPIIEEAKENSKNANATLQLLPQKVNYDLKRYINKKLELLEKRTMRTLAEILKEKIEMEMDQDSEEDSEDDVDEDD
jgi:coiled-coil domain-containing protein 12